MRLSERRLAALALPFLAALGGCSTTDPVPVCDECERWSRLTPVLGRYPAVHPLDADFVLFSTIEKPDSTALDAARQDDEDIWLTWIEDPENEDANAVVGRSLFAITDDDFNPAGSNTAPRWSPSGTRLAWVHAPEAGGAQIWFMDIQVPAARGDVPVLGTPSMLVEDARDPAWFSEDRVLFTRENKLFRIEVAGGPGTEVQISFDPPIYSSTDRYIDRHPYVSPRDGAVVFGTRARLPTGDIFVEAVETLPGGAVVETDAFVSFQSPAASQPTFPVLDAGTELQTPALMRGLPIDSEGTFKIGASLSRQVVVDTTRENYCDTTIVVETLLQPDTVDTVSINFEIVRGSLTFVTESTNATIFWTRADGRVSINDFGGTTTIDRCVRRTYPCLLPWAVGPGDSIQVGVREIYTITATSGNLQETRNIMLNPGETTLVPLFEDPAVTCSEPEPARASAGSAAGVRTAGTAGTLLRAPGDESNVWRLEFDANDAPKLQEIIASNGLIQSPVISREYSGGVRYAAWVSDETGDWQLSVQRLRNWAAEGEPHAVKVPGTFDNLNCTRNVFHPHWVDESAPGGLRLVVTMTECPDNEFPDIGFDQDPWPIGELRIWTVLVDDYQ